MSLSAPSSVPPGRLEQLAQTVGLAPDEWLQTTRLDAHTCRFTFRSRAASSCGQAVVLGGQDPLSVVAAAKLAFTAVDALSLCQRGPWAYPAVHLTLPDRMVVVALLHDHELEAKATVMDDIERRTIRFGWRRALARSGKPDFELRAHGSFDLVALQPLDSPAGESDVPAAAAAAGSGPPVALGTVVGRRTLAVPAHPNLPRVDGLLAELLTQALAGERSQALHPYLNVLSDQAREAVDWSPATTLRTANQLVEAPAPNGAAPAA